MKPNGFMRHVASCRNAVLPGSRRAVSFRGTEVGLILPGTLALLGLPDAPLDVESQAELDALAQRLTTGGAHRFRDENFDVRDREGRAVATIDRGALPLFGIEAWGVHANGLVRDGDGWSLWIGTRNPNKPLDPGKLDHLVAGGIAAGMGPRETLVKEAAEEAGIAPALAASAREVARLSYAMERSEGLRRDVLFCYDLVLPADFVPEPMDGEAVGFELWPAARVVDMVHDTDCFKFNVNLVLIDLFLRMGWVQSDELRQALDR